MNAVRSIARKFLLLGAAAIGAASVAKAAESTTFLDYVEVPSGAYFDTGIVPTEHETEMTFSCDYLNAGWIFGTKDGVNYYEFSMNNNYWRWGKNNASVTGPNVGGTNKSNYHFNYSEGKHTVVYRQYGTGDLIVDGDLVENISAATVKTPASATLLLGNASGNASAANFAGRIYAVKITDAEGAVVSRLIPCRHTTDDGADEICLYDTVREIYLSNKVPAKPVTAGPALAGRLVVTGTPFEARSDSQDVWYGTKDGLAKDDEVELSAPDTVEFGAWERASCTGWKMYGYDVVSGAWTLKGTGNTSSFRYVHDGAPTKIEWQWSMETVMPPPETEGATIRYVRPNGSNGNDGLTWENAYATPYAAVQKANAGDVILVAPGTYYGTEQLYKDARDYLTCIRLDKPVSVIGIGGPKTTVMDATYNVPRNGCYMSADGAFISGFTFTNSAYANKARNVGIQATAGVVSNCAFHCRQEWARGLIDFDATTYPVRAYDLEILYCKCLETAGETSNLIWLHGAKGVELDGLKAVGLHLTGNNCGSIVNIEGGAKDTPQILRNALIADNVIGLEINGSRGNVVNLTGISRLVNSTVVNNRVYSSTANGGVAVSSANTPVENCIIAGNFCASSPYGDIANNSNVKYVFNTLCNQLDVSGANVNSNLNGMVDFVDAAHGDYRLNGTSICIDAGTTSRTAVGETDIAGNPRLSGEGVDLGCYEYQQSDELAAGFTVTATVGEPGEQLTVTFAGAATGEGDVVAEWDFGDGTTATDWPTVAHTYETFGKFDVTLTVTRGGETVTRTIEGAAVALPAICYVREGAGAGTYPYDTWEKATGDIKTALSVGSPKVLVGPGTYTLTHSRTEHFISLDRKVELVSSEGPEVTIIDSPGPHTWCHRHFTISDAGAVVSGFTLTGGYTSYGYTYRYAAVLQMTAGLVTNCVVRGTGQLSRANAIDLSGTAKVVDCEFDGTGVKTDNGTGFQGAIYLYGNALMDRCRIHDYSITGAYELGGNLQGPVMLNENAELRNSLVYRCTNGATANVKYGGIVQVINGTIANCTIVDNSCGGVGAVKFFPASATAATKGKIVNSIVWGNSALMDDGSGAQSDIYAQTAGATVSHCCAGNFGGVAGGVDETNTVNNPNFSTEEDESYHLTSLSKACLDVAEELAWMADSFDCDGSPRIDLHEKHGKPDLGCFEFVYPDGPEPLSATLDVFGGTGRSPITARFEATVVGGGDAHTCTWDFGDGSEAFVTMDDVVSHVYETPGVYTATLTVASGEESVVVTGGILVVPQTCYVSANGSSESPYDTWEKAATNVLDAVGLNPKTVVVDDGVYYVSGEGVVLATDIELKSRNGAGATTIRGTMNYDQETKKYDSARLFWLNNAEAVIDGLTFEYGYTPIQGDAVCGKVEAGTLRNSVVTNALPSYRSPVLSVKGANSKVFDCVIDLKPGRLAQNSPNSNADGIDFFSVTIANGGLVDRCVIKNAAYENQGGQNANHKAAVHVHQGGTLRNSLVVGNKITQKGLIDGSYGTRSGAVVLWGDATVENCTIADNLIWHDAGLTIVPDDITKSYTLYNPIARNNIAWGNIATNRDDGTSFRCDVRDISAPKVDGAGGYLADPRVSTTCALELTVENDRGNFSADPRFRRAAKGNYRLRSGSPCIEGGVELEWMTADATDLDGTPRKQSAKPSMGCYEGIPAGLSILVK